MGCTAILKHLVRNEHGQGVAEYGLLLGCIVFGVWVLLSTGGFGNDVANLFSRVASEAEALRQ
jgi:Flp pilus assembly pilin Flp